MGETSIASLEMLEEKINRAAELIAELRDKKNKVEQVNKKLKEEIESLYISNEELTKELETFKKQKTKKKSFDKTREEIRNKIEEMLAKLERLDI